MERKKRSKGSVWEFCYANKIFGTFGVEMRASGQKLVKFGTLTHTLTHAAKLVVRVKLDLRSTHLCHLNHFFVTTHQFCQFISTTFANLTTFVNLCQPRGDELCQENQPLMPLQTRSLGLLLSTGHDQFCQP